MKIIFDKNLSPEILKAFGKETDKEGYIINKSTRKKVLSPDGDDVHIKEFAGIIPGSEIYLKSDIISLIKYVEKNRKAK